MPLQPTSTLSKENQPRLQNAGHGIGDILALGFGTTVAMWAAGYVGHMPLLQLPTIVFVFAMILCIVLGGFFTGRYTRRGLGGAVAVGFVSAFLNLLILGSLLKPIPGQNMPSPALWLPASFFLSAALAVVGSLLGARRPSNVPIRDINWSAVFALTTCAAALLLIAAGGLVTGFRSGLAVPDWPNSYGYNMFTFPFKRMTGGAFYEHAHRLLGALLGFATLTLAIFITFTQRSRRGVIALVWMVGTCVAVQGLLGGLRVTGNLTTATSGPAIAPSNLLAVVHGFFAHCVFGGLVAIAILLTRAWQEKRGAELRVGASTDHTVSIALVTLIIIQTLLGTLVRQYNVQLLTHITSGVVVATLSLAAGMRAWGMNPRLHLVRRTGITLLIIVLIQVSLGIIAVAFRTPPVDESPGASLLTNQVAPETTPLQALLTTAHQANAALLLAVSIMLALWTTRLLIPAAEDPAENPTAEPATAS